MPEGCYFRMKLFVGLSHEGAYTSGCQMPEEIGVGKDFTLVMVYKLVTIQNRSGPWIGIEM